MADTGWLSPSAYQSNNNWDDPTRIYVLDGSFASYFGSCNVTMYSFNISIPAGATITGIEARYYGSIQYDTFGDIVNLRLKYNSRAIFAPSTLNVDLSTSNAWHSVGGSTNLWGRGSWAISDFSNTNFAMYINRDSLYSSIVYCDNVNVKVYYTVPGWSGGDRTGVNYSNIGEVNGVAISNIGEIIGV